MNSTAGFLLIFFKLSFHTTRPYFENIELADMTLNEYTSAEFGTPSGHSMMSIMNPLMIYYYFTRIKNKAYWDQHSSQKYLVLSLIITYAFCVAYSRIYTGRHTLDQCISGFILGVWNINFYWNVYKPYLYDPS